MAEVNLGYMLLSSGVGFIGALLLRDALQDTLERFIPDEEVAEEVSRFLKIKKYKKLLSKWILAITAIIIIWVIVSVGNLFV